MITTGRGSTGTSIPFSTRRTVGAVFFVHGLLFASWAAHIPHVKAHLHLGNGALGRKFLSIGFAAQSAALIALAVPVALSGLWIALHRRKR